MKIKAGFTFDKETSGTIRYAELGTNGKRVHPSDALVGTLYIKKSTFKNGKYPKSLDVTIDTHS